MHVTMPAGDITMLPAGVMQGLGSMISAAITTWALPASWQSFTLPAALLPHLQAGRPGSLATRGHQSRMIGVVPALCTIVITLMSKLAGAVTDRWTSRPARIPLCQFKLELLTLDYI